MKEFLDSVAEQLLHSYHHQGGINPIDRHHLPSKHAVIELTQNLLAILFPGFLSDEILRLNDLADQTRSRLKGLHRALHQEVTKSLQYQPVEGATADALTQEFMAALPDLRTVVLSDVQAAHDGDPAATGIEEIILAYPGVLAIAVQRLAHWFYVKNIKLIPRIMTEWAHDRTGIDLHPGACIAPSFFIDHGTGVVVAETSIIGPRARLYQGVTLAAAFSETKIARDAQGHAASGRRHPELEEDVTIFAGATLLGNITVGARSIIGANVWLTQSVPSDSVVLMEDQKRRIYSRGEKSVPEVATAEGHHEQ